MKTKTSIFSLLVILNLLLSLGCSSNSKKGQEIITLTNESTLGNTQKPSGVIVYQSTMSNKPWIKLVLNEKNGTYKFWETIPSSGDWGSIKYEGNFKYEEVRGVDDGQRLKVYRLSHGEENLLEYDLLILSDKIGAEFAITANPNTGRLTAIQTEENPWN